jgi:hypothetical protein
VGALASYLQQVQQNLLHDPNGNLWTPAEVTGYINEARSRVAQDSKALRQVLLNSTYAGLVFSAGVEFYTPQTFLPSPFGANLVDVMGISVIVNNERLKLQYLPYTTLDAFARGWVNFQDWPVAFSRIGATQIVIAPVPNQNYPCDWDVAVQPVPLVLDTDPEPIPVPFTEPVQYYAAYKAKLKPQAQGEAKYFLDLYQQILKRCALAWMTRVIHNPYMRLPG